MQTKALFSALFICCTFFMACEKDTISILPSDNVSTQYYPITDFNELDISDPFDVFVNFSPTQQTLRIETQDNIHPLIEVDQDNGKLSIKIKDNSNIRGDVVLKVFLSTEQIETINAQGAAAVFLENQWNNKLATINLSGASSLEGFLSVQELDARLSGASQLSLQGSANQFEINADGASDMEGMGFATEKLTADLEGACNLRLTVNQSLNVKATGASNVFYKGDGVIESQNLNGGSQIIKVE